MEPYTIRNVIARIIIVLRRTSGQKTHIATTNEKSNIVKVEGLHLDMKFKRCTVDSKDIKLARKEFELLAYLISH